MRDVNPAVIKVSIQRMVCTGCGAEANASCNCGKPYEPKSARAREAVEAHPEKSDRAIAAEIGVSQPTVSKARHQLATDNNLSVDEPRTGLDGKTRRMPVQQAPEDVDEEIEVASSVEEIEVASSDEEIEVATSGELAAARRGVIEENIKLVRRINDLAEALNAKEAEASRDWPADMTQRQTRKRDKCLSAISHWQLKLERLYAEVTKQPPWRVERIGKDGVRYGNGARLATRGEAESYAQAVNREGEGKIEFEILPCKNEKANMDFVGTSILFNHGDCVLLEWRPLGPAPGGTRQSILPSRQPAEWAPIVAAIDKP
jgi:hypothetical protein